MDDRLVVLGLPALRSVRLETSAGMKRLTLADVTTLRRIRNQHHVHPIYWSRRATHHVAGEAMTTVSWYDYRTPITTRVQRLFAAGLVAEPGRGAGGRARLSPAGIKLVHAVDERMAAGALFGKAAAQVWPPPPCPTCWGSHACDLRPGHMGDHACLPEGADPDEYDSTDLGAACVTWAPDDPLSFPCEARS